MRTYAIVFYDESHRFLAEVYLTTATTDHDAIRKEAEDHYDRIDGYAGSVYPCEN